MTLSGRRPNERLRSIGKGLLEGMSALGTVMADGPKKERIAQIDNEIEKLQHEKDSLIMMLIEPGDLKVSEGYDPNKAFIANLRPVAPGEGRLVECKGRSHAGLYSSVHPACPYEATIHNRHDFTLRD